MLKPVHFAWIKKLFTKGSNSDVDPNLLPDGTYTDARNMRNLSRDGSSGALKQIGGEVLVYQGTEPGAATYICIGSCTMNGRLITFWANTNPVYPPIIQIDGVTSAMSPLIPYVWDRPLQLGLDDQCRNGIIFPADHNSDPLFWDVGEMVQNNPNNLNTQLYFSAFNPLLYSVGLKAPPLLFWLNPVEPLKVMLSGAGVPVGQYVYSGRWRDAAGNHTNWGPPTPPIPVPAKYVPATYVSGLALEDKARAIYPGGATYGGAANTLVQTQYGVNLRVRIDNTFGYESFEIKRHRYNDGGGITGAGVEEIIARIPVLQGQLNIVDFTDPSDANINPPETEAPNEADVQVVGLHRPKAVEFADRRLTYANVEIDAQPTDIVFREVDGRKITAITKKLVSVQGGAEIPDGYANPYHATYHKSAMRGEAHAYGLEVWNAAQGTTFAANITEPQQLGTDEFLFPNRCDIKGAGVAAGTSQQFSYGADSLTYSDDRIDRATTDVANLSAEGVVGATFDVMTQGLKAKTNTTTLVNVAAPAYDVGRDATQFNLYSNAFVTPAQVQAAPLGRGPTADNGYQPWHPTGNADVSDRSWTIPPNVARLTDAAGGTTFANQNFLYNQNDALGKVFAPTYQAPGALVYGPETGPSYASCISVVRSAPAGKVIMQGFGSYALSQAQSDFPNNIVATRPASKSTNALEVFFPDVAAGTISQTILDDIQANPSRYKFQIAAPYGFYNEVYGYSGEAFGSLSFSPYSPWVVPSVAAWGIDMVSYGRVMHDEGQVNAGEQTCGYHPNLGSFAPPGNYVGFDMWRRQGSMQGDPSLPNYSFWQQMQTGNALFDIVSLNPVSEGRANWFRLQSQQYIYSPECDDVTDGGVNYTGFNDAIVRNFHQPWFALNIVKVEAEVPVSNSQPYINTGAHIAVRTTIGIYTTEDNTFALLGEREWLDCVGYLDTDFRYAYVMSPNVGEQRFLCVTGNSVISIPTIQADILANGFWIAPDGLPVYGLYEMLVADDGTRSLRFGILNTFPDIGSRIVIKYDNNAPIRVFGHDVAVAPQIHAVRDLQWARDYIEDGPGGNTAFLLGGLPLPYAGFVMNPRYFMPESGGQTEEQITINYLSSLRQWCVVWDAETRLQPAMYVNATSTVGSRLDQSQFFPAVHYVNRLYRFNGPIPASGAAAGFFGQYDVDYPDETGIWLYGGLRFLPELNLDYAKQMDPEYFGIPRSGFIDNTDKCTWFCASNEFGLVQQDTPGLRTFTSANIKAISEETGEIKLICSANAGGQQNMYFWTHRGWGVVLTNKRTINSASGEVIGTQSIDGYWGEAKFFSRTKGLPDELWRLWAKGSVPSGADTFFWPDREGVYRGANNDFIDIAQGKWLKKALPFLQGIGAGYNDRVTGVYDSTNHEYLMGILAGGNDPAAPYVYGARQNEWGGEYGSKFDRYVVHQSHLYGMRGLQTFRLDDIGVQQNGTIMTAYGETAFAPSPGIVHEACAFRVHNSEPYRIEIYDKNHNLIFFTDFATQEAYEAGTGVDWVMNVDGWEQEVGRKNFSLDPNEDRCQSELFYLRVIYQGADRATLTTAQLQLQQIV